MSEWQPIETAPDEGHFLAERQTTGDWLKVRRWHGSPFKGGHHVLLAPTGLLWGAIRWMPLPAPPSGGESE
jgi:hypothetical protein